MWTFKSRQYREETSQKISWGHWFAFFNILWAVMRLSLIGRIRYLAKFTSLSAYLGILVLLFSPFIC